MQLLACFSKKSCSLCAINIALIGKKSCSKPIPSRFPVWLPKAPICAEMLRSNPMPQSIVVVAAAHICHTQFCSPGLRAMVNNCCLAKSKRKGFEILHCCCSPKSRIPKQGEFRGSDVTVHPGKMILEKSLQKKLVLSISSCSCSTLWQDQLLSGCQKLVRAAWLCGCLNSLRSQLRIDVCSCVNYSYCCSLVTSFVCCSHNSLQIILVSL